MLWRTKLKIALSVAVILGACWYAGYASELLKGAVSTAHRVILISGFIFGAGALSRRIMEVDIKRDLRRIKRARTAQRKAR